MRVAVPGVSDVLDWTGEESHPFWHVLIGSTGRRGSDAAKTAFTWHARAPDGRAARAMAVADTRRAFAVQAAMRASSVDLPEKIVRIRSCEEDDSGAAPFFNVGRAMAAVLGAHDETHPLWNDDRINSVGKAALRAVTARAKLREGNGVALIYGNEHSPSPRPNLAFTTVACEVDETEEGTEIGDPEDDLPMSDPLRAALIALAIAVVPAKIAMGERGQSGVAALAIPRSAVLRSALKLQLEAERAGNAALVAGFLREAGLPRDAAAFQAAYGD